MPPLRCPAGPPCPPYGAAALHARLFTVAPAESPLHAFPGGLPRADRVHLGVGGLVGHWGGP